MQKIVSYNTDHDILQKLMGCRTGFYLLLPDTITTGEAMNYEA